MIQYVSMTDTFMTWWIQADDGRQVKLVFLCYSELAADIVMRNAVRRGDMMDIEVSPTAPIFSKKCRVTALNHNDYPRWFYRNSLRTMGEQI